VADRRIRLFRRQSWLAGPLLLFVICCGFYWKLILTDQYSWIDSPDLVHMEVPRLQFQAHRWHVGAFPLWDPHQWCGQPFLGQIVGAANPVNWPFLLLPLDASGKIAIPVLHWYFLILHFLGGLFALWLCRDLGLSRTASLAGGVVFAFSGFFGSNIWPPVMGGYLWVPLVFLFLLRVLRGRRPVASAALCGLFLGASWLSGHHEVPLYLSFMVAGVWIYHVCTDRAGRLRLVRLAALAFVIAVLTSGFQTVPGYEYAKLAQRWVGLDRPLTWNETIPYSVDAQFSLRPGSLLDIFVPWLANDANGYLGVAAFVLAVFGVITGWKDRWVRLLAAVALFALFFAMGVYNLFHGILYAVLPLLAKARVPGRLLSLFDAAAAPLAAYGFDALFARRGPVALRRIALILAAVGGGIYALALGAGAIYKYQPNEHVVFMALVALLLAAVLLAWQKRAVEARLLTVVLFALILAEFNIVSGGFAERSSKGHGASITELSAYSDIAAFLRGQPNLVRIDFDDMLNFGDWEGIDVLRGFGAGVTSNLLQLEWWAPRAQDVLGVTYTVARAPKRPGQVLTFQGSSGFNVYQNPGAFPRVWTVHQVVQAKDAEAVRVAFRDPAFDLRAKAPLLETPPPLESCAAPDNAWMTGRNAGSVAIKALMGCRGMLVIADTWYPGWYATVDGRPAPIYQPYGALRGVVVDKGFHTVAMHYRPRPALIGAIMSAAGIFLACVLALGRAGRHVAGVFCLALLSTAAFAQTQTQEPVKTTLCEIAKQPDRFTGKRVQFRSTIESGVMYLPSSAVDDTCSADVPFFSLDEAHAALLLKSKEFRKLTKYLSKTPFVQATVTGWFEHRAGAKPASGLMLESVDNVTMQRVGRRR
jgi:hypothetical protein